MSSSSLSVSNSASSASDTADTALDTALPLRPRLLRCREVLKIVGFSRAYLYSLVADERFPKPIKIDNNCSRWLAEDVDAWIDQVSRQRGLAAPRGAALRA